jgi:hypothetical protein
MSSTVARTQRDKLYDGKIKGMGKKYRRRR